MNVNAEELDKADALLPGLFKFDDFESFSQAVIAVNEQFIYLYDDHAPSEINGDNYFYKVKRRFSLDSISSILDEKINKQPDLAGLGRIGIMVGEDEPQYFYYQLSNKKMAQNFLKCLKRYGLTIDSRKVSLTI